MDYGNLFDGSLRFDSKFKDFIHGQAVHELGWTCQDCLMPTYMEFYAKMLNSGKLETIDYDSKSDIYARDTIWEMFEVSTALMLSTPEILNNEEIGYIGEILDELYINFDDVADVENRPQIGTHKEKLRLMKNMIHYNYIGSFSLIDNTPYSSPNAFESYGDLLKVIYGIYGIDITKKMIPIEGENDDYYIHGFISYPEVTKGNRNSITTLVNGRVIKNNELNKCIVDCYHTYIHKDRYPVIVLNIDVDPILIDINIHPTKMDIKFSKMDTLKELVVSLLTKRLEELTLIPEVTVRDSYSVSEVHRQITLKETEEEKNLKKDDMVYEEMQLDFEIQEEKKEYEKQEKQELVENLPFELEEKCKKCKWLSK